MTTEQLAERVEAFVRNVKRVMNNDDLSASGQAIAIALLVTTNLETINAAAAALRALASQQENG